VRDGAQEPEESKEEHGKQGVVKGGPIPPAAESVIPFTWGMEVV